MISLPRSTEPLQPRYPYGQFVGIAAAGIMAVMAVAHLFRIDTFLPILQDALPFVSGIDSLLMICLVIVEVFAIPVLLLMRLSPLARIISALFAALAPLAWLWIAIWQFGNPRSIGLLGEFVAVQSNWLTLLGLTIWLALNCFVLWLLRFDSVEVWLPKKLAQRKS